MSFTFDDVRKHAGEDVALTALREGSVELPDRKCACVDWNAQACYEIRYNVDDDGNMETCECFCHDQEDGD